MGQSKVLYSIGRVVCTPIYKLCYRYKAINNHTIPESGGCILACNHISFADPVLLGLCQKRRLFFMAKSELFKNKFFGEFLNAIGVFAVKRGKSDEKAIEEAENILKSGKVLGIFIEGTRSKTGEFLRPKSGAAVLAHKSNVKIVPVCITGSSKDNKIHIFKKTIIKFNAPITPEELNIKENSRLEIKSATNLIMSKIKEMRD